MREKVMPIAVAGADVKIADRARVGRAVPIDTGLLTFPHGLRPGSDGFRWDKGRKVHYALHAHNHESKPE